MLDLLAHTLLRSAVATVLVLVHVALATTLRTADVSVHSPKTFFCYSWKRWDV